MPASYAEEIPLRPQETLAMENLDCHAGVGRKLCCSSANFRYIRLQSANRKGEKCLAYKYVNRLTRRRVWILPGTVKNSTRKSITPVKFHGFNFLFEFTHQETFKWFICRVMWFFSANPGCTASPLTKPMSDVTAACRRFRQRPMVILVIRVGSIFARLVGMQSIAVKVVRCVLLYFLKKSLTDKSTESWLITLNTKIGYAKKIRLCVSQSKNGQRQNLFAFKTKLQPM